MFATVTGYGRIYRAAPGGSPRCLDSTHARPYRRPLFFVCQDGKALHVSDIKIVEAERAPDCFAKGSELLVVFRKGANTGNLARQLICKQPKEEKRDVNELGSRVSRDRVRHQAPVFRVPIPRLRRGACGSAVN